MSAERKGGGTTEYTGPTKVSEFAFAGRSVRLIRPADPDRLLEDPGVLAWNARDDYMPYWAYLWPGAFLLAEAVGRASPGLRGQESGSEGSAVGWGWRG